MAKGKGLKKGTKSFAAKRMLNPPGVTGRRGRSPQVGKFQDHDALHRQGSFEGRGEHARTGNPGHQ
jgi:hypothetical protein